MVTAIVVGLIILLLLVLLLLSAIRLSAAFGRDGGCAQVRWLGVSGVYSLRSKTLSVRFLGLRLYHGRPDKRTKRKQTSSSQRWLAQLPIFWRLLKKLLGSVRLEYVYLRATVASDDPAWTGLLYGWASAFVGALKSMWPTATLEVQPDFVNETPEVEAGLSLSVRVFALLNLGWLYLVERRKLKSKNSVHKGGIYGKASA